MYVIEEEQPAPKGPHPVVFDVEYPERLPRLTTFFRLLLVIPQLIVVYLLFIPFTVVTFLAWFAILFTGRYPKAFFNFNTGVLRWLANVSAYMALLRSEYPPFSWEPGAYPLVLDIPRAERQSRFRLFIRWFAILPNQFVFLFVQLAWYVTTFIAWFAILITGRYPRSLFDFAVGVLRWSQRQTAYANFLRDEYPPYSTDADARPGNEVVSAIIGIPLLAAYAGLYLLPFLGLLRSETDTVQVQSAITSPAFATEQPSGEANGVRITLFGYVDPTLPPGDAVREPGNRFVAFVLSAEKDGRLPTFFTPFLLRLNDCDGSGYSPEDASEGFFFEVFWRGGEDDGTVWFQIPASAQACDLTYHSGLGKVEFVFPPAAAP